MFPLRKMYEGVTVLIFHTFNIELRMVQLVHLVWNSSAVRVLRIKIEQKNINIMFSRLIFFKRKGFFLKFLIYSLDIFLKKKRKENLKI